jgi:hypothetical protein
MLQAALPATEVVYVPEALDVDTYHCAAPVRDRSIDVIQFGRQYHRWHAAVAGELAERGLKYVHPGSGHWFDVEMFSSRESFVRGLQDSAISVCHPASVTDPDRSGGVEALTARYFESISAGCVLLGHCPQELVDLLGFDPVCPVDWSDPAGQVVDLRQHCDEWQDRVYHAQEQITTKGDWRARAPFVASAIAGLPRRSGQGMV